VVIFCLGSEHKILLMSKPRYDVRSMFKVHRTGQDRTGQDRTGQDRTGQDRTGQDRTGQDRTRQVGAALEKSLTKKYFQTYFFLTAIL
jgi:hypothetical protein